MAKIQFIYTEDGFKKTGSDNPPKQEQEITLQDILEADNQVEDVELAIVQTDGNGTPINSINIGYGDISITDILTNKAIALGPTGLAHDNGSGGIFNIRFDPASFTTHNIYFRGADGYVATEEWVKANSRQIRYTRTAFTGHNSTTNIVTASVPIDAAAAEGKRLHFNFIAQKTPNNGTCTVNIYLHDAAVADGAALPVGATLIGSYSGPANINDIPFERVRMFVKGGQIYPARPASSMLSDAIAQGALITPVTLPATPHILVITSVANASDTFTPLYCSLEY